MPLRDAKEFFDKLEKDTHFQQQIAHSKTEGETLQLIREQYHLDFTERECQSAFMAKYHHPLKKSELHKLTYEGIFTPEVAAKIPFSTQRPQHGE